MLAMTFLGLNEMGAVYGLFFVPYLILHLVFTFAVLGDARAQREAGAGLFLFWAVYVVDGGAVLWPPWRGGLLGDSSLLAAAPVPPVRRPRVVVSPDREVR